MKVTDWQSESYYIILYLFLIVASSGSLTSFHYQYCTGSLQYQYCTGRWGQASRNKSVLQLYFILQVSRCIWSNFLLVNFSMQYSKMICKISLENYSFKHQRCRYKHDTVNMSKVSSPIHQQCMYVGAHELQTSTECTITSLSMCLYRCSTEQNNLKLTMLSSIDSTPSQ